MHTRFFVTRCSCSSSSIFPIFFLCFHCLHGLLACRLAICVSSFARKFVVLYHVVQSRYGQYLDTRRSGAMRNAGGQLSINDDRLERYHDTAVGPRITRWGHSSSGGASPLQSSNGSTDSPFVSCFKEGDYKCRLCLIVETHRAP